MDLEDELQSKTVRQPADGSRPDPLCMSGRTVRQDGLAGCPVGRSGRVSGRVSGRTVCAGVRQDGLVGRSGETVRKVVRLHGAQRGSTELAGGQPHRGSYCQSFLLICPGHPTSIAQKRSVGWQSGEQRAKWKGYTGDETRRRRRRLRRRGTGTPRVKRTTKEGGTFFLGAAANSKVKRGNHDSAFMIPRCLRGPSKVLALFPARIE